MKKKILSIMLSLVMLAACFLNPAAAKADTIQAALTAVKLNKSKITLKVGKSTTLKATLYPKSSNHLPITFTTSNSNVKLVRKSNNVVTVKGVKTGTTTITVKSRATGSKVDVVAKCKVTVGTPKVIAPKSVTISSEPKTSTIYIGDTAVLSAKVSPSNATNKKIVWKSSNKDIATIDSKGNVSAKTTGTVKFTATVSGTKVTSTYKMRVKKKALKLSDSNITLTVGQKQKILKTKVEPSNAKVIWRSSNSEVAKVNAYGTVTALKPGNATITACMYGVNVQRKCKVTVKEAAVLPAPPASEQADPTQTAQ